jgi:hypothetical protein
MQGLPVPTWFRLEEKKEAAGGGRAESFFWHRLQT